jgi:hypothetical protein
VVPNFRLARAGLSLTMLPYADENGSVSRTAVRTSAYRLNAHACVGSHDTTGSSSRIVR